MLNYASTYRSLALKHSSIRRVLTVLALEVAAGVLGITAIVLLGILMQSIPNQDFSAMPISHYFQGDISWWTAATMIIGTNIVMLTAAAVLEFKAAKLIRNQCRHAYLDSLDTLYQNFVGARPRLLTLGESELRMFHASFATDAHVTFMALEALLKMLRPMAILIVFSIPLIALEPRVILVMLTLLILTLPFLIQVNRATASSGKGVFGPERKKVYSDIVRAVDLSDTLPALEGRANIRPPETAYDLDEMNHMLDNFDYWKLSSDRIKYVLALVKSLGLQIAVLLFVILLYQYESLSLGVLAILALGLLRITDAFLGLATRFTALSRLYPIVKRYQTMHSKFAAARSIQNDDESPVENDESGVMLLVKSAPGFRKSELHLLSQQLKLKDCHLNLFALAESKHASVGELTHQAIALADTLDYYLRTYKSDNPLFKSLLEQLNFSVENNRIIENPAYDGKSYWKQLAPDSRMFLNLMCMDYDSRIGYIRCSMKQFYTVSKIIDAAFDRLSKPLVVYSREAEPQDEELFDYVITVDAHGTNDDTLSAELI
ncbi:MAG: hypothetical protein HKN50_02905 [Gammaproteobacteria bacterium]|nr:hypothetical protein [Gammaproteobacteria bacterium]